MPLTRIEVCNFKSYRGHQIIGPFGSFTSIIGPNGAGKSNLMDAISFVLGIKSAQLRSNQLKDLIYRGRRLANEGDPTEEEEVIQDDRQGEGTASRAWVLAVYEDTEGNELKFQRTISMSGSSEYRLNGAVVTYQTYNGALEKQNILVKAKNFLVFQGDVEAVASQSSKDLARLIEQISGSLELVGEYERAKAAQDRATENATFNFTKRRGIATEIKQFKEQKSEAERFEKLCSERDGLILQRLLWKIFHIEEGIQENAQYIHSHNKELAKLREEQKHCDQKLAEAREDQAKVRSEVSKRERRIRRQEKALEAKQPNMVALDAQIAHSERRLRSADDLKTSVQKDREKQKERLERLRTELENVQKAANAAQEASRKAASQTFSLSEESLQEYRNLKAAANMQEIESRQQLETLRRDEKTQTRSLANINEEVAQFEGRKQKLEEEKDTFLAQKTELEEKLESSKAELNDAKRELEKAQSERTRIAKLEAEINEKLQECHVKLLQAGVDQKETEKEAKRKEVFANLQRIFPGVRGRVIDLCQPTQRKYETAVSVVLGRNIDALIVDHEKTAIECIEFLRNQRAGQATFIPLDTIQTKAVNDKYRTFQKGARLAVDCIQFDQTVERAMHHACGNALVCDSMQIARTVCYERGQEVKAVTLEGTIIHKSGLITGGRSTHGNNKKWEEKDVQSLNRQRDSLFAELRELNKSKPRGKVDENMIADINRLESVVLIAKDSLTACEHKLTGINDELKHINQELKKLRPGQTKLESSYSKLQRKIAELADVVNAVEDKVFAAFCRKINVAHIRDYEERQLKVSQEESEARLRFDTQIARLTHQVKFEEDSLKAIQDRLETLANTAADHTATLERLARSKMVAQKDIDAAQTVIQDLQAELESFQETLEEKTAALEDVKRIAGKASKALDKASKDIATKNDDIEKLVSERSGIYRKCRLEEIALPLLKGDLRNVSMEETIRDEMGMDINEDEDEDVTRKAKPIQDYGIEVDFSSLDDDEREDGSADVGAEYDNQIVKLSTEIERMAPNLKAMERLDDVQAKLIDTEKEAEKARKDSKLARDEFNEVRRKRTELFSQAYEHISNSIDKVYKDLTKGKAAPMGGVAYLSLEETEEPYLGGIKYHAMPPMKRFRDMDQLSGGEKTVAALALLFAIHSYKPSPFFVLDEVDAALDNTNVAKIANYIRSQASDQFQFVVISLKGSLYERGNSLVGIYRDQEVNSSRTLTLELTQYDK